MSERVGITLHYLFLLQDNLMGHLIKQPVLEERLSLSSINLGCIWIVLKISCGDHYGNIRNQLTLSYRKRKSNKAMGLTVNNEIKVIQTAIKDATTSAVTLQK